MSPPTRVLMHPILCWMIDNVSIRSDSAGNVKADKGSSAGKKIDGAVAFMAQDRAIRHEGEGSPVYVIDLSRRLL